MINTIKTQENNYKTKCNRRRQLSMQRETKLGKTRTKTFIWNLHLELCHLEVEDIRQFLLPNCPILQDHSRLLLDYMKNILEKSVPCSTILDTIILQAKDNPSIWVQFVLDCSVLPQVIAAGQDDPLVLPLLFKVTRTYCYSLHRTRLKILGRWTA